MKFEDIYGRTYRGEPRQIPVDTDNPTQVGRALRRFGIELIPAYSPEARIIESPRIRESHDKAFFNSFQWFPYKHTQRPPLTICVN